MPNNQTCYFGVKTLLYRAYNRNTSNNRLVVVTHADAGWVRMLFGNEMGDEGDQSDYSYSSRAITMKI
jgi:hypothetical protein